MTEPRDEEIILDAEYSEKSEKKPEEKPTEKKKEPGLFSRFMAYRKKNLDAMKKSGEPGVGEEFKKLGMDWGASFSKGMAEVGREEEAKLSGKSSTFRQDDGFVDELLTGTRSRSKPQQPASVGSTGAASSTSSKSRRDTYTDQEFIEKLCEFLRYVAEDDDVGMWQNRGKQFTPVDYKYLGKLLTRYLGYKVTLKDRDLSIK